MRTGRPTPGLSSRLQIAFFYNVGGCAQSFLGYPCLTYCGRTVVDAKRFGAGFSDDTSGVSSSSRGLVGDTSFAILPNVKPMHTFLITLIFQSVFLVKLWRTPTHRSFLTALTLCGYTSFMFGWHVHEKAILLVLVPLR